MSETKITSLNLTCLFAIFEAIKFKCDIKENASTNDVIKYADLINFALSCEWIRKHFYNWEGNLYEKLGIKKFENSQEKFIDFGMVYDELRNLTPEDQNIYLNSLFIWLRENKNLKKIILKYTSGSYNREHTEIFNSIILLQQKLPNLSVLEIDVEGNVLDNLHNFRHIKELHLNAKINAEQLVNFCESNPNLRVFSMTNNEIYGNLSDIALGGNKLQNLEKLDFLMKPGINADQYAPFGNLPKLNHLRIRGEHEIDSLSYMFNKFAANNSLTLLVIDNARLSPKEVSAISQIKSLMSLETNFAKMSNIGELSQLRELIIKSNHEIPEFLSEILNLLKSTNQESIFIAFQQWKIRYMKWEHKLECTIISHEIDLWKYRALADVPNLSELHILAFSHKNGSLRSLIKRLASKMPQTLRHLRFSCKTLYEDHNKHLDQISILGAKMMGMHTKQEQNLKFRLNYPEISEISKLKSLESLNAVFDDLSNINDLDQLPALRKLIMNVPHKINDEEREALETLFHSLGAKSNQTLIHLDITGILIDMPLINELVKIKTIQLLSCELFDAECVEPLSNLYNLSDLHVKSSHDFDSISQGILQILLSINVKIKIDIGSLNGFIIYDSTEKEMVLNLDKYMDVNPYAAVGDWDIYDTLIIVGHCDSGSLYSLFEALSKRDNHRLKQLYIENYEIDYDETLRISEINSLKILTASFSSFGALPDLAHLKKIKSNDRKFHRRILNLLNNSNDEIIFEIYDRQIIYNKNNGKLILKNISTDGDIYDAIDYACLGDLDNLKVLHIIGENKYGSLEPLFVKLSSHCKLQELLIREINLKEFTIVDVNEIEPEKILTVNLMEFCEITKIVSLKKLKFGFSNVQNIEFLLELKELEDLTITTHVSDTLIRVFEKLSFRTPSVLQYLTVEKELNTDELKAIAKIPSLKKLKCNFQNRENKVGFLPEFPYLKELHVTAYPTCRKVFTDFEVSSANSALETINIEGVSLDVQDLTILAQHKSLKTIKINLRKFDNLNLLYPIGNLEELCVNIIGDIGDSNVMVSPRYPPNLHKLTIKNQTLCSNDMKNMLNLRDLKFLDCAVDNKESINLAILDQIEKLVVTLPNENCAKTLFEALAQKNSSMLKHICIKNKLLNLDETWMISKIKTLTTLECGLLDEVSLLQFDRLINLTTLIITSSIYHISMVGKALLEMFRKCKKLKSIDLIRCQGEITERFLNKALYILKEVRNPNLEGPLQLRTIAFRNFEMDPSDEQYLIISHYTKDETEH